MGSLNLPDISNGDPNNTVVLDEHQIAAGISGIVVPKRPPSGAFAWLVYALGTMLFQPLLTVSLLPWRCGFPFRIYSAAK